jgi:hypothetical protein
MADGTLKQLLWQFQESKRDLETRLPRDDPSAVRDKLCSCSVPVS